MDDFKLEMLLEPERISKIIEHGAEKKFPRETLSIFSDPRGRLIVANAIANGEYRIDRPRIIEIPKKHSTEKRKVYANPPLDRFILALINSVYYDLYKNLIHPNCVSYQKGIGVRQIVGSISRQLETGMTGYKADLSKYFDSVNIETIEEYLQLMNTGSALDRVLWDYYHDNWIIDEHKKTVQRYKSLAQGCAFGTLLANLVLRDIDAELSSLNILYYRYSDDLLMLGPDADKAKEILEAKLIPKGLKLNPKKVQSIDSNVSFTFLGFDILGREVSLSQDSVDNFKNEIRRITKVTKDTKIKSRQTQKAAIRKINAYLYNDYLKSSNNFGWLEYFATISTNEAQMKMLDEFAKDHLKAIYTGKFNHTTNRNKTSNEKLEEMGYRSMVNMYKLRRTNKQLYETILMN